VPTSAHDWSPLVGPARLEAELNVPGELSFHFGGRGYHDRNGSSRPFDRLGIRHWIWGRAPFHDHEAIYYALWPDQPGHPPEVVAMTIDRQGTTRHLEDVRVIRRGPRLARYGMPSWSSLDLEVAGERWLSVRMEERVDDGPFYLRFLSQATNAMGESVLGTTELVRPARVDRVAQRPFVRMKVHRVAGDNSNFLALFTGPSRGRFARQLGELLPARRSA
jgi:hypothetical protein